MTMRIRKPTAAGMIVGIGLIVVGLQPHTTFGQGKNRPTGQTNTSTAGSQQQQLLAAKAIENASKATQNAADATKQAASAMSALANKKETIQFPPWGVPVITGTAVLFGAVAGQLLARKSSLDVEKVRESQTTALEGVKKDNAKWVGEEIERLKQSNQIEVERLKHDFQVASERMKAARSSREKYFDDKREAISSVLELVRPIEDTAGDTAYNAIMVDAPLKRIPDYDLKAERYKLPAKYWLLVPSEASLILAAIEHNLSICLSIARLPNIDGNLDRFLEVSEYIFNDVNRLRIMLQQEFTATYDLEGEGSSLTDSENKK